MSGVSPQPAPEPAPARPRWPLLATLMVGAAIALMIGLGIWQLGRAREKAALLAQYAAAASRPPIAFPAVPRADPALLFRRAAGFCLEPTGWSARAGRSREGQSGWRHIAVCRTGAEGPGMAVDMGWSAQPDAPTGWRGGRVSGTIDRDRDHLLLLVSDTAAPGLQPSARPDPATIPDNHLAYAVQWFAFAAIAAVVFVVAVRRRHRR